MRARLFTRIATLQHEFAGPGAAGLGLADVQQAMRGLRHARAILSRHDDMQALWRLVDDRAMIPALHPYPARRLGHAITSGKAWDAVFKLRHPAYQARFNAYQRQDILRLHAMRLTDYRRPVPRLSEPG